MAIAKGSHRLGPDNGSLVVKTFREGVASKVGHDLVLEVADWEATLEIAATSSLRLRADPRSLRVQAGLHGLKPLSDKDRAEILRTVERKVLGTEEIAFRSRHVVADGERLAVEGDLTLAGTTRPVGAEAAVSDDGRVAATIPVLQTNWGIEPYRGLLGALKVRDEVEVVLEARLPAETAPG